MKELKIASKRENIPQAVDFVKEVLQKYDYSSKKISTTMLMTEELLVNLINNANSTESIVTIGCIVNKRRCKLKISCKGKEFVLNTGSISPVAEYISDLEEEEEAVISSLIISAYSDKIKLKNSKGINRACIIVDSDDKRGNKLAFLCIFIGIFVGLILRFCFSEEMVSVIANNITNSFNTVFLNAITALITPLVFFSIASSVCDFSDFSTFGRVGMRVIVMYLLTSLFALMVGTVGFMIFQPGSQDLLPDVLKVVSQDAVEENIGDVSPMKILIDMVPSNVTQSFLEGNMLQIIVIALVIGCAAGMIGEQSKSVQNFLKSGNALFTQVAFIISKLLPLYTFSVFMNLTASITLDVFKGLAFLIICIICSIFMMIIIYIMICLLIGRLNPIPFFKKFKSAMLIAFSTCSSNITMPETMKCLDNMGVSSKVYSFSIPLGTTINMDGSCIVSIISVLFMARVFNVEISISSFLTLMFIMILLSMGLPGIPGAGITCLMIEFMYAGVPSAAVLFVCAVFPLTEFIETVSNVIGDAIATLVISKKEGLIDLEQYNK